ncbi:MAG: hypothetical protein NTX65_01070 [Ignavibacteriales bacterium]|nr:hypothetical protein [Ignavibacteriales bacterium]
MGKYDFIKIVSLIGLVGIFILYSNSALGQDKEKDELTAKFLKRIETLETLVKEQGKLIEMMQKEIDKIKKESPLVTLPPFPNNLKDFSNKLPNGATPFHFNGQTYYMVPLNKLTKDQESLNKDN